LYSLIYFDKTPESIVRIFADSIASAFSLSSFSLTSKTSLSNPSFILMAS